MMSQCNTIACGIAKLCIGTFKALHLPSQSFAFSDGTCQKLYV